MCFRLIEWNSIKLGINIICKLNLVKFVFYENQLESIQMADFTQGGIWSIPYRKNSELATLMIVIAYVRWCAWLFIIYRILFTKKWMWTKPPCVLYSKQICLVCIEIYFIHPGNAVDRLYSPLIECLIIMVGLLYVSGLLAPNGLFVFICTLLWHLCVYGNIACEYTPE